MEICGVCAVCRTYGNRYAWGLGIEGLKEKSQNARPHKERAHLQLKGHKDDLTLSTSDLFIHLRHGLTL